jgi:hypothetical protein
MRITDPTALETLACREAIALALYLNINRILVASDCKGVVEDVDVGSLGANVMTPKWRRSIVVTKRAQMSPRGGVNRRFKTFMSGLTKAE